MMITEGEPAPEFVAPGTKGEDIDKYRLSDHTECGVAVLVFYPFDFSPVCTDELCAFRDAEWLYVTEGVDVLGVSLDSCYAHKRFMEEYDLTFPLLSDTTGTITEKFGVAYDEWEHHAGVAKRALVTVDDSNEVVYTWKTENAYEQPTMDELHATIASLL